VHLFSLVVPTAIREQLYSLLDPVECARAARFHAEQHRHRFIVAHGRLRQLLAAELLAEPRNITYLQGAHGKPLLADAGRSRKLHFNLSHSADWGMVGTAWGRELGVDVEVWRDMHDEAKLVQRYFSETEVAAYEALPMAERRAAFFRCWTRKEAYIKALGRGLSLPLSSFDVSLESNTGLHLLRPAQLDDDRQWSLAGLDTEPGLSAAVALESAFVHIFPTRQNGV
jgi:4'-phosphopantetheinyl transferase